jgi:hypothetical protein
LHAPKFVCRRERQKGMQGVSFYAAYDGPGTFSGAADANAAVRRFRRCYKHARAVELQPEG